MFYPLLTAVAGGVVVLLAVTSLTRHRKDGSPLGTQLRFLVFGVVLMAHFPLTQAIEGLLLSRLSAAELSNGAGFAHWGAIIMVVAFQVGILPTFREIHTARLLARISRGQ